MSTFKKKKNNVHNNLRHCVECRIFWVIVSPFKVQTRQRKSCRRRCPAQTGGWSPSTVCPLCSVETLPPGKWWRTSRSLLCCHPPELCFDTLTSLRSSEWRLVLWTLWSARSCGWEASGGFPPSPHHCRCRRRWTTPGCTRSTGRFWGWWFCCCVTLIHPEWRTGLYRSSTPAFLARCLRCGSHLQTGKRR